jgi:stage II sporulation protein D
MAAVLLIRAEAFAPPVLLQIPRRPTVTAVPRTAEPPHVRVRLTAETAADFELEVSGSYRIESGGPRRSRLEHGERLAACPVTATAAGLRIGNRTFAEPHLEILPSNAGSVWVDGHAYRGTVQVHRIDGQTVAAVNHVPLEAYVASVVDSEMPAEFGPEARKAQAVVARTYAVSHRQSVPREAIYDLYGSTRSQKYLGFQYRAADGRLLAGESEAGRRAAADTAGMICTYGGRPFCTYYSAVCGGQTMYGTEFFTDAAPPLTSVRCDWCRAARHYRWEVSVPRKKVEAALQQRFQARGLRFGSLRHLRPAGPPIAGRLTQFEGDDGRQRVRLAADELRELLGNGTLLSPKFTVELRGEEVLFRGAGSGHGVGLCQWGARGLDHAGHSMQQILAFYYPGVKIVVAPQPR